ncbi:Zinc finger CCCH domain-containing protein 3 [Acanthosepion pharaonis]|uniref:Zinc finger CCCH domain-containing protein 3 n=1 Tax=Acanthosepion pharaonis TaxID=158019 RepID=A0A812D293_ACAPH|nr:Zinc finger CCCH domain-containing protein 3 [Sepia pharaonis]
MADDIDESALYIKLLKGTVLTLQDRVNREKRRLARYHPYSSHVYPYHKSMSPARIKPTYSSHSFVFLNPKMNYTKVNSRHTTKAASTSQAVASTYLCKKHPAVSVNRTVNHKNLTFKKVHVTPTPKTSTNVAQTSSQLSTSTASNMDNQLSKGGTLKNVKTGSKLRTLVSCTQQQKSTIGVESVARSEKSTPEKLVLKSKLNSPFSTATRTCITNRTSKVSPAATFSTLSKIKPVTFKAPVTNTASISPFVERRRYKIVREHKLPAASQTVASTMTRESSSSLKSHTVNTRFSLVKRPDTFMQKSGYSYVSKRCLHRAKVISLSNSEAGKSYIKKLGKLIIDAGKKFDKKPLVMVSKRKISRVPLQSTPILPKRKSSVIPPKSKLKVDHRRFVYHNLNSSKILISPLALKHKLSPENQKKWFLGAKRFINTKFSKLQTVTVQGVKYRVEAGGKNLRRLDSGPKVLPSSKVSLISKVSRIHIGGAIFTRTSAGVLKRVNTHKLIVANRAVNKSIATAVAKGRKVQSKPAKKPCLYFNNFGKCKRVKCPYVHDPKKIAVCRRMIQGTCKVSGCPFYHKLAKEKMPTCYYFLKGHCNRDNCIYPHVKVNKNAHTCEDFLNGYCSRGEKCTMKHFFVCQKFQETQVCSHNACKFKSRQMTKAKMPTSDNKYLDADHGKKKKAVSSIRRRSVKLVPSTEPIPITENLSFISLGNSSEDSLLDISAESTSLSKSAPKDEPKETLRIRPRL